MQHEIDKFKTTTNNGTAKIETFPTFTPPHFHISPLSYLPTFISPHFHISPFHISPLSYPTTFISSCFHIFFSFTLNPIIHTIPVTCNLQPLPCAQYPIPFTLYSLPCIPFPVLIAAYPAPTLLKHFYLPILPAVAGNIRRCPNPSQAEKAGALIFISYTLLNSNVFNIFEENY